MTDTTTEVDRRPGPTRASCGSAARSRPAARAAHGRLRRRGDARSIVLDFTDLEYMNSGGIGLLVTLLVRAQRPTRSCSRSASPSTTARSSP